MKLSRRLSLFLCSYGWHPRPFGVAPHPRGSRPSAVARRHHCRRCGLTGRLDVHGNLDPDRAS